MYLWRKTAEPRWLKAHEEILQARFGPALTIISRPECRRVQIEIAHTSRKESLKHVREFGGCVHKLPRDWLKRIAREQKSKPLTIGERLIVTGTRNDGFSAVASTVWKPSLLIIPAGAAFGTGEHLTTTMSLRLLERLTRQWKPGWSAVDLGTGSGILALAAKRFGARRVWAIDSDTTAISTAKENARINKINNTKFLVADVGRWKLPARIDIITANLFSELLIELLPKLKRASWLILSGVLRAQEKEFVRALRCNKIDIAEVRRRGKWVAILARQLRRS
jgi:ribosomal protein L11 methyltransferase